MNPSRETGPQRGPQARLQTRFIAFGDLSRCAGLGDPARRGWHRPLACVIGRHSRDPDVRRGATEAQPGRLRYRTMLLGLAAVMTGCMWRTTPAATTGAGTDVYDPCAERLHDACGQLLLYYSTHQELPQGLDDLSELGPELGAPPLVCPTSGKPYVYDRQGLQVPGWPGRLVVYDAEPCHAGRRWGIVAEPPQPGKPLVVRVARPPENAFRAASRPSDP